MRRLSLSLLRLALKRNLVYVVLFFAVHNSRQQYKDSGCNRGSYDIVLGER